MPLSPPGRRLALAASLALLGACQLDRATGADDPSLAKNAPDVTKTSGDTVKATFVVSADGALAFNVGDHKITFGNKLASICDPVKSSYGATEWDKACTPASAPVTITAKSWYDASGHPLIDFQPRLRFVPTSDPAKQVTLAMKDKQMAQTLSALVIRYCVDPKAPSKCVDESKTDAGVATYVDTNGFLVRKLKHFSGYNVAARDDAAY